MRKREAKIILFQCNPFLAVPSVFTNQTYTQPTKTVRADITYKEHIFMRVYMWWPHTDFFFYKFILAIFFTLTKNDRRERSASSCISQPLAVGTNGPIVKSSICSIFVPFEVSSHQIFLCALQINFRENFFFFKEFKKFVEKKKTKSRVKVKLKLTTIFLLRSFREKIQISKDIELIF